jgi:hypothetical protein
MKSLLLLLLAGLAAMAADAPPIRIQLVTGGPGIPRHAQFGPWNWTMVQIEYAGDRDFQVQGNVFGRFGGRATDWRTGAGHKIRASGSRGGADSPGNDFLARVCERLP